ncbi:hypothetical protein QQP08_017587, partial [Theobroma cacao]
EGDIGSLICHDDFKEEDKKRRLTATKNLGVSAIFILALFFTIGDEVKPQDQGKVCVVPFGLTNCKDATCNSSCQRNSHQKEMGCVKVVLLVFASTLAKFVQMQLNNDKIIYHKLNKFPKSRLHHCM